MGSRTMRRYISVVLSRQIHGNLTALGNSYRFRFSMDVSSLMCLADPCQGQPVGIWTCEKGSQGETCQFGRIHNNESWKSQEQMRSTGASKSGGGQTYGTTFIEGTEEGRKLLSQEDLLSHIKQCGLLKWH